MVAHNNGDSECQIDDFPAAFIAQHDSCLFNNYSWLFDTGASRHITVDQLQLVSIMPYNKTSDVKLGNGSKMHIDNFGYDVLNIVGDCNFSLNNLLHVPKASSNLIFVNKLCHHNNVFIKFFPHGFFIRI